MGAKATAATRTRKVNGGLEALQKRLAEARKGGARQVKVGLPKGAADYPDGTSVIAVGATHEFGSDDGTIPERSFLRAAFRKHIKEYRKLGKSLGDRVQRGEMTQEEALEILGTRAAADVKEMIAEVSAPPNAESTVRAKGSSNPLIDTGHLRQQITHEVEKK